MKKLITIGIAIFAASILAACGDKENVSFDQLETQRSIANENSKFNATKWRGENGYENTGLIARGDSTQQPNCPQGDGWASVDLVDSKTKQVVVNLKCSTVSANVGCSTASDFKSRPVLASQENSCNTKIPPVLKKIEG